MRIRRLASVALLSIAMATPVAAQGYRLRIDSRYQSVSFRGVDIDSIRSSDAVTRPGQGYFTPDGFAVDCTFGNGYCYFFRPGTKKTGHPFSTDADLTLWGFGVPGVTVRASGRVVTDLASGTPWPATEPNVMLTEGYAEYAAPRFLSRLGRQFITGRLGYQGFDGGLVNVRLGKMGLELGGYGGSGLARAVAIPVTSPALNPLDDFQPRDRQLLVGLEATIRRDWLDAKVEYRRELDPTPDYVVSERAAATAEVRPLPRLRIAGGAEYDFANGWWGTTNLEVNYRTRQVQVGVEGRRYRPFFDLWTIWGAFSPVPYSSLRGNLSVTPMKRLWLRASGERYWFDDSATDTPLTEVEDRGWRAAGSAIYTIGERWTIEGGTRIEFGPGASSRSFDGGVTYRPSDAVMVAARGGSLDRPLEFRFAEASLVWAALSADIKLTERLRLVSDLGWFDDQRKRPDPAAFDFDQFRIATRLVVTFGGTADRLPKALPPSTRNTQ